MAQVQATKRRRTVLRAVQDAARAASGSAHAASGMAWTAGFVEAARMLRSAEAFVRSAIALMEFELLAQEPTAARTAGGATLDEQPEGALPPRKRKPRKKKQEEGRGLDAGGAQRQGRRCYL